MNFLRLNARTSSRVSANHSPLVLFDANRACQYASMPEGSSVAMTWTMSGFSGSSSAIWRCRRGTEGKSGSDRRRAHRSGWAELRGRCYAAAARAWLRERHDEDWWRNPRALPAVQGLFARGGRPTLAELFAELGVAPSTAPLVEELQQLCS